MYNEPILKRKKIQPKGFYIALIAFALVLTLGLSYAFFIYREEGNNHVAIAGNIFMESTNSGNVSLTGLYPMTDEDGIANGIKYSFDVSGYNLSNKTIYYGVYISDGDEVTGKTRFRDNDIKLYLTKTVGEETTVVYGPDTLEDFNRNMIYASTIDPNIKKEDAVNISYELTMWIDEKVLISDTETTVEGRSIYTSDEYKNSYASVKVEVYGDFQEKELPIIGYITYDMSSLGISNPSSTPIYSDNTGTITSEVTSTTLTNFLGWSTTQDGEVVYQPGDTINASDIVNNNLTLYPVIKKDYLVDKITSTMSLTEADVDGTRFVYGETVDNNYVWYSGKLWRIVSIDSDGNIKLVTQVNMTTIAWATLSSNTDYSTSQMRTWLNTEFFPTLENADTLVASSTWDYTTYESFPASKDDKITPTTDTTVTEKVGLLNIYEFMMTGGTVSSGTSKTFLNNGYYWWLSSHKSGSNVWIVNYHGRASSGYPLDSYGARPSINLVSNIQIDGGSGTETDPYRIKGDKTTGQTNELLNNRVSGEYINFNNTKYRIVGIENGLTKITMADYDINGNTLSTSVAFGASESELTFSTAYGIGKYLNDWYDATSESDTSGTYTGLYLDETYKSMIATQSDGVRWYAGPDSGGTGYDYTKATQGTAIEATIGLGRYGEIFSSQFGNDGYSSSTNTWLITKYSGSDVWYVYSYGRADFNSPTSSFGARPSFYLKSDVKIIDGTGMPNDPYELADISPVCTISGDTDMTVGETYTYNIECTDAYGFGDSEITTSDITISNSSVLSISSPVKSTITNGYKYAITVTPLASGTTTISLDAGSVSDTSDNGNVIVTSSTITVTEPIAASGPVCAFVSSYYTATAEEVITIELDCTAEDEFTDADIITDDFEVTSEYGNMFTISGIAKNEITNGYRYTIGFIPGSDMASNDLWQISLKANSVATTGGGNESVSTTVESNMEEIPEI